MCTHAASRKQISHFRQNTRVFKDFYKKKVGYSNLGPHKLKVVGIVVTLARDRN